MDVHCTGDKEQVKEAVEEKKAGSQEARVEPTAHCHELLDMNSPEARKPLVDMPLSSIIFTLAFIPRNTRKLSSIKSRRLGGAPKASTPVTGAVECEESRIG